MIEPIADAFDKDGNPVELKAIEVTHWTPESGEVKFPGMENPISLEDLKRITATKPLNYFCPVHGREFSLHFTYNSASEFAAELLSLMNELRPPTEEAPSEEPKPAKKAKKAKKG